MPLTQNTYPLPVTNTFPAEKYIILCHSDVSLTQYTSSLTLWLTVTLSLQRVPSSLTPCWCRSTVSLTTSTTRPSVGTLTSGTERLDGLAPIGLCDFAALPCSSPAASMSSPASSLSAARQKRPGKVSKRLLGSKLMFYLAAQHLFCFFLSLAPFTFCLSF